jgi:uncharacterized membrane protein YgaE (UPF0421/DUF939 family)
MRAFVLVIFLCYRVAWKLATLSGTVVIVVVILRSPLRALLLFDDLQLRAWNWRKV